LYSPSRRQTFVERPVLYKIYSGKVAGIKEFGAFVTLERVAVRATAVGRDAERKAERNAVLAGDPKGLDYYVILL